MKKWSLQYEVMRRLLRFGFHRFYGNIEIYGLENIPQSAPVIFSENHTNAVIDPVLIAAMQPRQPGFLARSDVFKNKMLNVIFRSFKMLPVYRQRDRVNTVEANKPIFDAVINHLDQNGCFIIAPEGDKGIDHHLLPPKKGVSRIAIQKMERDHWGSEVYMVPVGITYSTYSAWGGDVVLRFGEPIAVSQFKKDYKQMPAQVHKIITEHLGECIKPLMWHVEGKSALPWLYRLKKLNGIEGTYRERMEWCYEQVKKLQHTDHETRDEFLSKVDDYLHLLDQYQVDDNAVAKAPTQNKMASQVKVVMLAPLALTDSIFHFIPLRLAKLVLRRMDPHPHFYASILFGLVCLLMPMFYFLYFLLAVWITKVWWMGVIVVLLLPGMASAGKVWKRNRKQCRVSTSLMQSRTHLLASLRTL